VDMRGQAVGAKAEGDGAKEIGGRVPGAWLRKNRGAALVTSRKI
jgi:hypothetical protein